MITQKRLKELLNYDSESGVFTWKVSLSTKIHPGQVAGSFYKLGYRMIGIGGKPYFEHRLAWLYVHGELPNGFIDHINRNPSDNSIANLRILSNSDNTHNGKLRGNNKSGIVGVFWNNQRGMWSANIKKNYKNIYLGLFENIDDAIAARLKAEKDYFNGVRTK